MNNSVPCRRRVLPPSPSSSSSSSSPAQPSPPPAALSPRRTEPRVLPNSARHRRQRPPASAAALPVTRGRGHGPQGPQEDPVLGAGTPQPAGPPRRRDDPPAEAHAGHALPALRTFLPRCQQPCPAHPSLPGAADPEDESLPYQRSSGEGCLLKPKRTNPCAYTPPSLKAVQRIVQSHLESGLAGGDSSDGEGDDGEHELAHACDPDSALEPALGSQARAERSYFPAGPKAHKRKGGQKVSFAGGIEERGEDLKSLTVSEIPEDPEGAEGDEEEAGREQEDGGTGERRHIGFAEVPSRPISTERHSPTFPLGTS
ncbi:protein phosphatase 1 regulatory subunit 1B isoform X2 [Phalacrocorax carbo]|uniref:protein phosphatase 1 regulatory subunit 1B isoform X2 n=1 Tax=Phalacrocorax carbo TaxID=9209 RepID=UPI00311A503B